MIRKVLALAALAVFAIVIWQSLSNDARVARCEERYRTNDALDMQEHDYALSHLERTVCRNAKSVSWSGRIEPDSSDAALVSLALHNSGTLHGPVERCEQYHLAKAKQAYPDETGLEDTVTIWCRKQNVSDIRRNGSVGKWPPASLQEEIARRGPDARAWDCFNRYQESVVGDRVPPKIRERAIYLTCMDMLHANNLLFGGVIASGTWPNIPFLKHVETLSSR
jgi:hypothetical protein